ncbi:hypothetical protein BO86DRAFT_348910 [Aspergillus japonicus CBS 114.51]|uniref:Peptidase S33 tripeptidyl aminopeptidase-like C-terminal domain-containing protein n=1 Tax=Aspergillus japonicus CBS 114.51 TaxID=1448312 RepID=A0A8T8WLL2_ASPJA|nr:hypothetical protein BO86DRAFT_348910 [Aspergillus japonicus CBS 114.51]RAH76647.1 hypothetical protein BO86DRAFT_348910 [Aspergillus japonicus CBS 114.51]
MMMHHPSRKPNDYLPIPQFPIPPSPSSSSRFAKRAIHALLLLLVGAVALSQFHLDLLRPKCTKPHHGSPHADKSRTFSWDQITPTKHLIYHPCFDGHECARLALPMDWNRTDTRGAAQIALAVIRRPAKVPVTDPRYGGPILLNPGGPGGSGVSMLLKRGRHIQTVVDASAQPAAPGVHPPPDEGKFFDVVSFDPRGVNNTTPPFSCFRDSAARRAWKMQVEAEGILGSSDGVFDARWARHGALGLTCTQSLGGALVGEEGDEEAESGDWIGRFMNTPTVVADMVELIERHGEWRERETARILGERGSLEGVVGSSEVEAKAKAILRRNRWVPGQEKLQYWGFSYGTVLGSTFAAMQPHRIHRAVIDGVCDVNDYYAGGWLTNLQDADVAWLSFFELCNAVGPEVCSFASGQGGLQATIDRYENLLTTLKANPVAVPASGDRGPDIITYSDVKMLVMQGVYTPMESFERVARFLTDLTHGNGSAFAEYKQRERQDWRRTPPCDPSGSKPCMVPGENTDEAQMGILCSDGQDIRGIDKEKLRDYWHTLRNQSKTVGDIWAEIRFTCIEWKARPAWQFEGRRIVCPIAGNTSHPLLFAGNTYDPVTPLRNAFTMSKQFPGSVVLQQNSVGHCTLSGPSLCSAKVIREYFQTGELPSHGKVCEVEEKPFHVPGVQQSSGLSAADLSLLSALRSLAQEERSFMRAPPLSSF